MDWWSGLNSCGAGTGAVYNSTLNEMNQMEAGIFDPWIQCDDLDLSTILHQAGHHSTTSNSTTITSSTSTSISSSSPASSLPSAQQQQQQQIQQQHQQQLANRTRASGDQHATNNAIHAIDNLTSVSSTQCSSTSRSISSLESSPADNNNNNNANNNNNNNNNIACQSQSNNCPPNTNYPICYLSSSPTSSSPIFMQTPASPILVQTSSLLVHDVPNVVESDNYTNHLTNANSTGQLSSHNQQLVGANHAHHQHLSQHINYPSTNNNNNSSTTSTSNSLNNYQQQQQQQQEAQLVANQAQHLLQANARQNHGYQNLHNNHNHHHHHHHHQHQLSIVNRNNNNNESTNEHQQHLSLNLGNQQNQSLTNGNSNNLSDICGQLLAVDSKSNVKKSSSYQPARNNKSNQQNQQQQQQPQPQQHQQVVSKIRRCRHITDFVLGEEEKRLLIKEGYEDFPMNCQDGPLSKTEERILRRIRRKIRNKKSAQCSRQRKKEYVEELERKYANVFRENQELRKILDQIQRQQPATGSSSSSSSPPPLTTCSSL